MRTQEIADRRRLFELFTWLLEHRAAAKDPQAERKREDEVQGTVKHCIELWTGMMKVRLRRAPLTIFSVRRRVRLSTTTSLLRELWGWFPTRTGWHCASAKRCRLLPAPLFRCCRAGLAWTAVLLSKQLAHAKRGTIPGVPITDPPSLSSQAAQDDADAAPKRAAAAEARAAEAEARAAAAEVCCPCDPPPVPVWTSTPGALARAFGCSRARGARRSRHLYASAPPPLPLPRPRARTCRER